jgi:hypothetical protein
MAIIFQHDKRSGITYAYDSKSYYDKTTKSSRAKRTLIGRVDPETGEIVPTDGRNKRKKDKDIPAAVDKDKLISQLQDENRQLKLQVSALEKELNRLNKANKS